MKRPSDMKRRKELGAIDKGLVLQSWFLFAQLERFMLKIIVYVAKDTVTYRKKILLGSFISWQ
jgi:hypothetical protein